MAGYIVGRKMLVFDKGNICTQINNVLRLMVFCGKVEIAEDGSVKGIADAPHYKPMEIQGNLQEIA